MQKQEVFALLNEHLTIYPLHTFLSEEKIYQRERGGKFSISKRIKYERPSVAVHVLTCKSSTDVRHFNQITNKKDSFSVGFF